MRPLSLRWLIPLILVVLLLPACGDSADDDAGTTLASTPTTVETTTTNEAPTTTPDLPGVGDLVRDGNFEFVVGETEQPGNTYAPLPGIGTAANGVWFIVNLAIENIGDGPQLFPTDKQEMHWEGGDYSARSTEGMEVEPGYRYGVLLVFDVPETFPEGGVGAVLELHDSASSDGVTVSF